MIKWVDNHMPKSKDLMLKLMSLENVESARTLHRSFPQYSVTPLASLKKMAGYLGLRGVYVKDESWRFGLNSFKALGASYAVASYIAKFLGKDVSEMSYDYLTGEELKKELGQITFYSATDGNHGRAVAWAARELGQKAVIVMPRGTSKSRFDNIAREGADVTIEDLNYDECVRKIAEIAEGDPCSVIIQDTVLENCVEAPNWIMQGYGGMAAEACDQLESYGIGRPTHVLLQAGVGSAAGAVQGYIANRFPGHCPTTVIMEPDAADCYYQSALAGDGGIRIVTGEMNSMMAGLACGEPNPNAFDIIRNHASFFVSCPDSVSALGMRMLGAPIKGDPQVISGESGAIGMGFIASVMLNPAYADLKAAMDLNSSSTVLMFSTEGNTDPDNYRDIVWGGKKV